MRRTTRTKPKQRAREKTTAIRSAKYTHLKSKKEKQIENLFPFTFRQSNASDLEVIEGTEDPRTKSPVFYSTYHSAGIEASSCPLVNDYRSFRLNHARCSWSPCPFSQGRAKRNQKCSRYLSWTRRFNRYGEQNRTLRVAKTIENGGGKSQVQSESLKEKYICR